jgi:5-formyltetrahydrofolate cyclo-ligase
MKIDGLNTKKLFRAYAKKRVQKYELTCRYKRDKYVVEKLEKLIKINKYKNILLYIPLNSEVDVLPLINKIRGSCTIYVPFMEGVSFKMVKFRLPLFKKRFTIKEPKNSFASVSKLDLAIVPVLGVDGNFGRIGFGKGMYDRFFESLEFSPAIVFVQLGECFTTEKLCDNFDIRADVYITPYKTMIKRGNNDNRIKYGGSRSDSKRHSRFFYLEKTECSQL